MNAPIHENHQPPGSTLAPTTPAASQGDLAYMPSKYSKAFNTYSRTQIKTIMPFIASISRTCTYSALYPICKVLKAISKIYMLNQIQVIFLAYLIKETAWDIRDKTIFHNAENVQDIIYYSIDNLDYKRIILYLMITAYTVKFYLNQNTNDILEEATKRCPNFRQIFQSWNKKHSVIITKINPRTLNIVYKRLYSSIKEDQPDFNMIVDAIIQISPAYNPEREKQGPESKKKVIPEKKEAEFVLKKEEPPTIKQDKSSFIPSPVALFSSSGLLNMMTLHQQALGGSENVNLSGLNPFMLGKSDRIRQDYLGILGSSVVGGIEGSGYEMNQEDDCGELVVGLHDGQSQQNIIFEDKAMNSSGVGFQPVGQQGNQQSQVIILNSNEDLPYYTSVITLTRRASITGPKDSLGTSQIFLPNNAPSGPNPNPNSSPENGNKNKRQASIVNLDAGLKQAKDKEKQKQ